jgi:hypothetical protein
MLATLARSRKVAAALAGPFLRLNQALDFDFV